MDFVYDRIDEMTDKYGWDIAGVNYLKDILRHTEWVFNSEYLPDFDEVEDEYEHATELDSYIHFALLNYAWNYLDIIEAEIYDRGLTEYSEKLENDRDSLTIVGSGVDMRVELGSGYDLIENTDIDNYFI